MKYQHNLGNGNLYVAGLFNPIPEIGDFNECDESETNDCGEHSLCINTFGGFTCQCFQGAYYKKWFFIKKIFNSSFYLVYHNK